MTLSRDHAMCRPPSGEGERTQLGGLDLRLQQRAGLAGGGWIQRLAAGAEPAHRSVAPASLLPLTKAPLCSCQNHVLLLCIDIIWIKYCHCTQHERVLYSHAMVHT